MKQVDTIVLVENVQKSAAFYKDIFGLEVLHDWESMVIFKNRLAIHQFNLLEPREMIEEVLQRGSQGCGNLIIYLELEGESIEKCFERLKGLDVEIIHEIVELPWQRIFRVYDPDKHIIEIGEPMKE